jgi:hypothetical protein
MTPNTKIGAIALATALLGGTAGAFISRTSSTPVTPVESAKVVPSTSIPVTDNQTSPVEAREVLSTNKPELTPGSDKNYRDGFVEGFQAARDSNNVTSFPSRTIQTERYSSAPSRVVYRSSRPRYATNSQPYYSSNTRYRGRSFWDKHRDKLTVAMGSGGGALIGGLIGGRKGAAIGALAGGGGSALYTYKIRNKNRRY